MLFLHFSTLEVELQHCNRPEAGLHGSTYSGGRAAWQCSGGVVTEAGLLCSCSPVT